MSKLHSLLDPRQFAALIEGDMASTLVMKYGPLGLWRNFLAWLLAELQEDSEEAGRILAGCPDAAETWARWWKALEGCVRNAPNQDILGPAHMRIRANSQGMGQFFSPQHVADLMARLLINPADKNYALSKGRLLRGSEPTCGSGVMILVAEKARLELGQPPILWQAMDMDRTCAQMCAIQCRLNDIPAIVLCGDSLSWGTRGDTGGRAQLISPRVRIEQPGKGITRLREVSQREAQQVMDQLERHALNALKLRESAGQFIGNG